MHFSGIKCGIKDTLTYSVFFHSKLNNKYYRFGRPLPYQKKQISIKTKVKKYKKLAANRR